MISSFRITGIYPCDRNALPAGSLIPAEIFNTEENKINTEEEKNYNETKDGLPAHSQVKRPHKEKACDCESRMFFDLKEKKHSRMLRERTLC